MLIWAEGSGSPKTKQELGKGLRWDLCRSRVLYHSFFFPPSFRANLGNKEHPALQVTAAPPALWVPPV